MTVKMLTNVIGTPAYTAGEVVELRDDVAVAWIKDGLAKAERAEKGSETAARK